MRDTEHAGNVGGDKRNERANREVGETETQRAADNREHHRFGDEQTRQVTAGRAKRAAYGQLFLAAFPARQQKVGHVRNGNQEYEPDRSHQDPELATHVADEQVLQRLQFRTRLLLPFRRAQLLPYAIEIRLRVDQPYARFQTGVTAHAKAGAAIVPRHVERRHRHVDLDFGVRISGTGCENAHDGVRTSAEDEGLPDDCGILAERLGPELMTDDHHGLATRLRRRLSSRQRSTHRWRQAEGPEEISGDGGDAHALGGPATRHRLRPWRRSGKRFEHAVAIAPVPVVGHGDRRQESRMTPAVDRDLSIGVAERKRPEQYGVDDAEDCGVGGDRQCDREDRDQRKARSPDQRAYRDDRIKVERHPDPPVDALRVLASRATGVGRPEASVRWNRVQFTVCRRP